MLYYNAIFSHSSVPGYCKDINLKFIAYSIFNIIFCYLHINQFYGEIMHENAACRQYKRHVNKRNQSAFYSDKNSFQLTKNFSLTSIFTDYVNHTLTFHHLQQHGNRQRKERQDINKNCL